MLCLCFSLLCFCRYIHLYFLKQPWSLIFVFIGEECFWVRKKHE
jgi:hypothetical protein